MATKQPRMIDGLYVGRLTISEARNINTVIQSDRIKALKNKIYDIPMEVIQNLMNEGTSIRNSLAKCGLSVDEYKTELRDYQTVAVGFLYLSKRSILTDGAGLGKTAVAAGLINYLFEKKEISRFLFVCENNAIGQIQYELIRRTGLMIVELPPSANKMDKSIKNINWNNVQGIIIRHSSLKSDTLSKWLALNINEDGKSKIFNTIIIDESSVLKNSKIKTYDYAREIIKLCDRVHMLNATPFELIIDDIYNQIDIMDSEIMPIKSRFEKEFCKFKSTQFYRKGGGGQPSWKRDLVGYKNQEIFKERTKLFLFGRSVDDVGLRREHKYSVYEICPNHEQMFAISKGHRYMEVLNCPSLVKDMCVDECNRENTPKLDALIELLDKEYKDKSVMVFCFHVDAQTAIYNEAKKIGRNPIILNGRKSDKDKLEYQQDFNNKTYDLMITNAKKSLDLYGGDICIFYTVETNPSKAYQIGGRIDRNIDDSIKEYVLLLYKNTPENNFFNEKVKTRALHSRELTTASRTVIDYFVDCIERGETKNFE